MFKNSLNMSTKYFFYYKEFKISAVNLVDIFLHTRDRVVIESQTKTLANGKVRFTRIRRSWKPVILSFSALQMTLSLWLS